MVALRDDLAATLGCTQPANRRMTADASGIGTPFMSDMNIDIDEALVRSLLREQHPDLAEFGLREVIGGWDNQMWRLGEELAVRMPRTPRAPALLRTEQQWLPILATDLPLPVSIPVRVGEPSARFPKTWTVVRWVAGEPA